MKREVAPQDTTRAQAFALWMKVPNPMVTFFKTLDVTRLVRISRRKGLKFNMLMDWCIGKAAADTGRNQQSEIGFLLCICCVNLTKNPI